jgi:hypothetical protein
MSAGERDLVQFDALKAKAMAFVAPTLKIRVESFKDCDKAIDAAKTIKSLEKQLDDEYERHAGPLKRKLDALRDLRASAKAPLKQAETYIKAELGRYDQEQERIRAEERRKAEAARREAERKAEEDRLRALAEAEERRKQELAKIAAQAEPEETGSIFGSALSADEHIEAERAAAEEAAEQERLAIEARAERERKEAAFKAEQDAFDIAQRGIKNARKTYEVEVVNIDLVPTVFLNREINKKAVLAAHKAGHTIPGVRIIEGRTVAIGRNTYVPDAAHDLERLPGGRPE